MFLQLGHGASAFLGCSLAFVPTRGRVFILAICKLPQSQLLTGCIYDRAISISDRANHGKDATTGEKIATAITYLQTHNSIVVHPILLYHTAALGFTKR